jgi:hypothetical protein
LGREEAGGWFRHASLFILAKQSSGDAHGMFRELLFSA